MKVGKKHLVPLSEAALKVLVAAEPLRGRNKAAFIFPGKPGKPLSDMTLTKVLRDMGYASITVHGLRTSFRVWAAEQTATLGDVVEAALAHAIRNKVEAAYRRTNYLEKRRELMGARPAFGVSWRAELDTLIFSGPMVQKSGQVQVTTNLKNLVDYFWGEGQKVTLSWGA